MTAALLDAGSDLAESYTLTDDGPVDTPETPAWWLRTLAEQLAERRRRIQPLWDRYKGDAPLPELGNPAASRGREQVWKAFQRKARINLAELVVRSIAERLTPIGTRVDAETAPSSAPPLPQADVVRIGQAAPATGAEQRNGVARRIWMGNRMAVQAGEILEKFLVMGYSYAIVMAPDEDEPDLPVVTAEDPRYVITYQDPARPSRTLAALKLYHDPLRQRDVGWLYLPGRVLSLERAGKPGTSVLSTKRFRMNPADWVVVEDRDLTRWIGKRIPVVLFENHDGEGEFENHTDHLDRINHMLLQRIVIATLQAFRQRAAKGVPTHDPKTGQKIDYTDVFTNDPGSLWLLPAAVELWESGQVDLSPLLNAVKDDVRDLAAVLRLPVQHFMPDATNGSAEGAAAAREGLIYRTEDRQTRGNDGFGDVMALAFGYLRASGGDGAALPAAQSADGPLTFTTLWRPIERFSLAERYDAASKANGILPWEMIMTDIIGYEPDDLPRLRAARADDALIAAAAAPATAAAGGTTSRAAATSGTGDGQPSSAGQSGSSATNGGAGGNDRPAGRAGTPARNGSGPAGGSGAT